MSAVLQLALRSARPSSNGYLRAICPYCPDRAGVKDTKWSFAYSTITGVYRCMRCHVRGAVPAHGLMLDPDLVQRAGGTLDEEEAARIHQEATRPPPEFYLLDEEPARSSITCRPAIDFLEKRGVGEEKRRKWGIGVCLRGRMFGRIIIPVLGTDGKSWCGYVARAWTKQAQVPYLYPRGFSRGEVFFNQEALLVETDQPILLVEGAFDTISMGDNAAAVLGSPSWEHIRQLLVCKRPRVWVLDCDVWQNTYGLMMMMRASCLARGLKPDVGAVRLPSGADPDEVDPDEVWRAAHQSLLL